MTVKCLNCLIRFEKKSSEIKKSPRHFCSRSCNVSYQNRLKPKRVPQGKCRNCGRAWTTTRIYCGVKCRIAYKKKNSPVTPYESVRAWRQRTKARAVEYMGGKCQNCGYDRCLRALAFHHLDPGKKDFGVSSTCVSWKAMVRELKKCTLLCSNCHMELHAGMLVIGAEGVEPSTSRLSAECSTKP